MTPEGEVKKHIDKMLKTHCAWFRKPVQNGMGSPMLDYVGHELKRGIGFHIEAKKPGGEPTARQKNTARDIYNHGGVVFLIRDHADLMMLDAWLQNPRHHYAWWGKLFDLLPE